MIRAEGFIHQMKNPDQSLPVQLDEHRLLLLQKNRSFLRSIFRAVAFLGKQGLPFRGHGDTNKTAADDKKSNPGNFRAILALLGDYDPELKETLETSSIYLSPDIQNEIIELIAKEMILNPLLEEIKKAKFYSILADEISSHHTEQLALCIRFVDEQCNIREEFIQFSTVLRADGATVAAEILESLKKLGVLIEDCRGQGYDGCSSMSSNRVGVQARIKEVSPLAVYQHCCSHNLNLVI